jgi:hypothetical protein
MVVPLRSRARRIASARRIRLDLQFVSRFTVNVSFSLLLDTFPVAGS